MEFNNFGEWYSTVKPLTQNEYENSKVKAERVILKRIGDRPTKDEFKRENKTSSLPVLVLITIVFLSVYVFSVIEQWRFMGYESSRLLEADSASYLGIPLNKSIVAWIFQITVSTMTEFAMILFMVQWRLQTKNRGKVQFTKGKALNGLLNWLTQFFNTYFLLAILSMMIVLYINITSGMFILIGVAVPLFTIGLGLGIEEYISEYIIEQDRIYSDYTTEYNLWGEVSKDPTKHPSWKSVLYQSIWDSIVQKNKRYSGVFEMDVAGNWKALAVEKELERDDWSTKGVKTKEVVENTGLKIEDLQGKNELEILLAMVEN